MKIYDLIRTRQEMPVPAELADSPRLRKMKSSRTRAVVTTVQIALKGDNGSVDDSDDSKRKLTHEQLADVSSFVDYRLLMTHIHVLQTITMQDALDVKARIMEEIRSAPDSIFPLEGPSDIDTQLG